MTSSDEIALLAGYMPLVVRSAGLDQWERKFVVSTLARIKRGTFRPTDKQVRTMRRLVQRFQEANLRDDNISERTEQ